MEKIFAIKGTNLTIHMPKELITNAEEIKREADRLLGTRNIRSIILISRRPALWTAPASAWDYGRVTKHPLRRGIRCWRYGSTSASADPPPASTSTSISMEDLPKHSEVFLRRKKDGV